MLKNVLCDRDGTIIYDKHYLCDPAGVELLPGAASGLAALRGAGMRLFVVTNQSGIGRGMYGMEQYLACERRLDEILSAAGAELSATVYCPHAPEDASCRCRKPEQGMWLELQRRYALNAAECAMIGDKMVDIEFGKRAGLARTVLVLTGKGLKSAADVGIRQDDEALAEQGYYCPRGRADWPDCVALDMGEAAAYLLSEAEKGLI